MARQAFDLYSDEQLLMEYAQRFCEDSFTELHDRHQPELMKFLVYGFGLEAYEADEILQLTWLQVSEKSRDSIANFAGWVRTIAERMAISYLRNPNRSHSHEKQIEMNPQSAAESPLDDLVYAEDSAAVAASIRLLGPLHRQAILAIYSDGLTVAQASARLGVPAATLWRQVEKAKQEIRARVS